MAAELPPQDFTAPMGAGRLDRWLSEQITLSRSRLQALIKEGAVEVEGEVVVRPSHELQGGETVRLRLPPPLPSTLEAQDIPVTVLYADDHLIVVDKPAELVVHPSRGHRDGTLVNALLHQLQGAGGDPERPGIVHRLDRGTSGTMVVARTEQAHAHLAEQFAARTVHRRYLALCWGIPAPTHGTIDAPHGRHPRDRLRFAVVEPEQGKRAVTHYHTFGVGRPYGVGGGGDVSLLGCRLETGRTHQIRVHLEHIGHPLVGDPLYGAGRKRPSAWAPLLAPLSHQLLHAAQLGFVHPQTGAALRFETPPPPAFQALTTALRITIPAGATLTAPL